MMSRDVNSHAFRIAELQSECVRVTALLGACAALLALVLTRGIIALSKGYRGEAWPFALLLAFMAAYEFGWLAFIKRRLNAARELTAPIWIAGALVESLLPTAALFLQIPMPSIGPQRVLTSPVVLVYFVFILLSTLHLDPRLSLLTGIFSAVGYAAVSAYVLLYFAAETAAPGLPLYVAPLSCAALLIVGGIAAAAVARQIRMHVSGALREAEARAKVVELQHDLAIARSIQQGLLPKTLPRIEGFDIAGWNQPADETGGDYFDWQQVDEGAIAITIADVTGHGIGSALCMAACRAYARAAFATERDLRSVICRMNRLLYDDLPAEKFVTLAAAVLDPDEGTFDLISAGHGPLLFYIAAEDRFRCYDAQGLPLGLMPHADYGCPQALKFGRGDMLIFVTDGFIEWANQQQEQFGEERLQDVIRAHRHNSAATIISELYSAVVEFAGPVPQADDLTAMIVKRI